MRRSGLGTYLSLLRCARWLQAMPDGSLLILPAHLPHLPARPPAHPAAEVKERMPKQQFNLQQLSNLLWSLAIAECCDPQVWADCISQVGGCWGVAAWCSGV